MVLSKKEKIAKRVAQELSNGEVVNLGIGLPTLVTKYIPNDITVYLHAENGVVGIDRLDGDIQSDLVNAGGMPAGMIDGAAFIDSLTSFSLIRGGHVDTTVLGGLQVDAKGNLANWMVPGKSVPGMGGAMDLVVGAKRVIITMEHTAKDSTPKIIKKCEFPLTAEGVVNMIITDLAVFEFIDGKLTLIEIDESSSLQEIRKKTEANFVVSDKIFIRES